MQWFKIRPIDTLYIRGNEPMVMGEDHTCTGIFPPPPETFAGALRTAYLRQKGISIKDYKSGNVTEHIIQKIGAIGTDAPFSVAGPLLMKDSEVYIPAPYSWYFDEDHKGKNNPIKIIKSRPLRSKLLHSCCELHWVNLESGQLKSAGGKWLEFEDINKSEVELIDNSEFFSIENRTGIALDYKKSKKVREGCLYTFGHARLAEDTLLVFGIDKPIDIEEEGTIILGAEKRIAAYSILQNTLSLPAHEAEEYMALSPVKAVEETNSALIATGKIQYMGGWDMHKGFHKPVEGYYPAGSVFTKRLDSNFISLKGGSDV